MRAGRPPGGSRRPGPMQKPSWETDTRSWGSEFGASRHRVHLTADVAEVGAKLRETLVGLAQLVPLRPNETAVRRDALAHPRRAAADLPFELRAQRVRQAIADVGDLGPHLRLGLLALGGDDEEAE